MEEMRVEMMPVEQLTPYERNARAHGEDDIAALMESIRVFGFRDPIGVWGPRNIIVEGHGRLMAAKRLGLPEVPVIRLDDMSDEQRRAYALAHNRTAELSRWDETVREMELAGIDEIDMRAFRFDVDDLDAQGEDFFQRDTKDGAERQEGNAEYNAFLEKFEAKKTTDDCYTPENVYGTVAEWVAKEYGADRARFVRPFYPGGDYQGERYPTGCAVVDNPPFSILAEIVDFYLSRGVKFFLFCSGLVNLSYVGRAGVCAVCVNVPVTYENGAVVNTGFITNMEAPDVAARGVPELYEALNAANDENVRAMRKSIPKYEMPDEVLTASKLGWLSHYGQGLTVRRGDCTFVRYIDAMRESKDTGIFGGALLLSERAAAERAAAERAAAERAAAERAAAERAAATKWQLSEREWAIVRSLGEKD